MSDFDPTRLGDDIATKAAMLRTLAADVGDDPWGGVDLNDAVIALYGMGSSYFAAAVAARRLRAVGVVAVAERASVAQPLAGAGVASIVVSNGGSSPEALAVATALGGLTTALTNQPTSPLAGMVSTVVELGAGAEVSGVSAKSYAATLVRLLQLERSLRPSVELDALGDIVGRAADAIDELVTTAPEWVEALAECVVGPQGTWMLAPAERIGAALQGALMLRETPRLSADGCETGDWSHVDVYLTRSLDYRAIVFAGSAWDATAAQWLRQRHSRWWAVGVELDGAERALRYAGDDDPLVALLAEVTVAELLAAHLLPSTAA